MDAPSRADFESLEARRTALPIGRLGSGYGVREVDGFVSRVLDAVRGLVEENDALRAGVSPESLWSRP